ncbi:MAG: hypothetical protein ACREYF_19825 [Gammaproteobacteria bacterium]
MNTCKTCRHFNDADEYENWKRFELGKCNRVPMFWDATQWSKDAGARELKPEFVGTTAFVQDGSDYMAVLIVAPTFGCLLHESSNVKAHRRRAFFAPSGAAQS